ncbi:MAG: NAD(P)/FAD-dependent oxidoreductase [Sphingorhabdus sp.]
MTLYDVAIIGAGIAGASLAAKLCVDRKTILIEAEEQAGYHATGRSAAFWSETYGGPDIQPLTKASYAFLNRPPKDFSETGFLKSRGALYLGTAGDRAAADRMQSEFIACGVRLTMVDPSQIASLVSGIKPQWPVGLLESDCCDIDVGALHQAYLRMAKRLGSHLAVRAPVEELQWTQGYWDIRTRKGSFKARIIVNAAGAWADNVAMMAGLSPLGIRPYRRTIVQLKVDPPASANLPLVVGLDGSFYFKPDVGGRLWLSPHDEVASAPCDAAPEEIDIARAIARLEDVVDWRVGRVEHVWAGLRSFAPDRLPVIGFSDAHPAFFWLAGQGGFGIQTAPAIASLAASLLTQGEMDLKDIDPHLYTPHRFL